MVMKGHALNRQPTLLMCGALLALPQIVEAMDSATIVLNVTVTAPPPCTINGNRPIEVEFGDVITTRVDGTHYRKPLSYTLVCDAGARNAMQLQVTGTGAAFDNKILQTNNNGLGIKLMRGETPLSVNTWVPFTYPNKPELWAIPVRAPGVALAVGEFSAAASMQVDYQ